MNISVYLQKGGVSSRSLPSSSLLHRRRHLLRSLISKGHYKGASASAGRHIPPATLVSEPRVDSDGESSEAPPVGPRAADGAHRFVREGAPTAALFDAQDFSFHV